MDKKQIFEDLQSYQNDIKELETLKQMKNHIGEVKSPVLSKIGTGHNYNDDRTLKAVQKIMILETEIEKKEVLLLEKTERIFNWVINECPDAFIGQMCYWHYIKGLNWSKTNQKVYGYCNYHTSRKAVMRYFEMEQ